MGIQTKVPIICNRMSDHFGRVLSPILKLLLGIPCSHLLHFRLRRKMSQGQRIPQE